MRILKQEIYFPIIVGIHFIFWAIDLYFYAGNFTEVSSDTLLFGELTDTTWKNPHRILGEVFSSWVVTVFAFNFLMATRARWIENLFGGLDKMYLVHRRSGIIAVVLLLAHFIVVPRDLVAFNAGKLLGFYAFILILLGVLLSAAPIFKRKISYHKWLNFHKLMGVFYVLGVIHGILVLSLIKELPITRVYVFGMAFIGIGAWLYKAFFFKLFNKKLGYTIVSIRKMDASIVEIEMKANTKKLDYKAGQFAFFTFPSIRKGEQHPFTISSHPNDENLVITVKSLGDFTEKMIKDLQVGEAVFVEGPYGKFSSAYSKEKEQVWIAGGIGITPFVSLIKDFYTQKVTLYWSVSSKSEAVYKSYFEEIAAQHPLFDFVLWNSDQRGYLSVEDLSLRNPETKSYLICGPSGLKSAITKKLLQENVKRAAIYDEEFAFR
ncbi:ferric reductase-like transmembrane domain-containing protein [uncultured Kordia sp.]|uniref:ferredoxin reductase family protein n=1 Tax=uncultured Kordia sp. TaxID=507699 RepID=UPI0026178D65|nr:ferric reductase-like transmembrane domain-containing protein [uncultured Kordia sp.]